MVPAERDSPVISMGRRESVNGEPVASPWCMSPLKRLFDLVCAIPALFLFSFAMLIIGMLVRLTSKGPSLFRQQRIGLYRRTFTIYKFRTMYHGAPSAGPCVTKVGDSRLTPLGRLLRKYKLDELPQLYNVLRGDMSLVGPRPKLPQHELLEMQCRPGITGAATLAFANEEFLLQQIPGGNLEQFHVRMVSPLKRLLDCRYHQRASFRSDLGLLVKTIFKTDNCRDIGNVVSDLPRPACAGCEGPYSAERSGCLCQNTFQALLDESAFGLGVRVRSVQSIHIPDCS